MGNVSNKPIGCLLYKVRTGNKFIKQYVLTGE